MNLKNNFLTLAKVLARFCRFSVASVSRGRKISFLCKGESRSNSTLFLSVTGGPIAADAISRVVSAYVSAGAPAKKGSCHLFRHTAATLMLDAGADVRFIAEMLSHQKLETTMNYTRVSMAKLQEVHARCHPAEQPHGSRALL